MSVYLADANIFITMQYYYRASFPSFWNKFTDYTKNGTIVSIEEVFAEIGEHLTEVREWADQNNFVFQSLVQNDINTAGSIISRFPNLVKLKSVNSADPYLVARARNNQYIILTNEKPNLKVKMNNPSEITKIPDVCSDLGVAYISLEDFMVKENWVF